MYILTSSIAILNFALYSILNYTLKIFKIVPLTGKKEWLFRNTFCSFVHSTISSVFVTYSICRTPHLMQDPINAHSIVSSCVFAASTGYFLYDMVDLITSCGFKQWILILHHLVILFALPYSIATNSYHGFGASALLMEWNSIFLHVRKMLKLQEQATSTATTTTTTTTFVYKLNTTLLLVTMLIFRFLLCFHLVFVIWRDRMLMSSVPFLIGMCSSFVFIPANIGLFYQICVKDLFTRNKKSIEKTD